MIVCLQAIRFIVFASVGLFGSFPSQVLPYWCHPCSWSGFDRGHHRRVRPVTEVSQSLLYEGMFISLALVLASLDNTSTLVFCSLGMCDISIESKLSILFMTVTRYFYRRASFICVSPLLRKPPAENPSSLELLGRLGLELGRALVSQLCTLPGCWSPRIQTRRIIRPSILLCFQGWHLLPHLWCWRIRQWILSISSTVESWAEWILLRSLQTFGVTPYFY